MRSAVLTALAVCLAATPVQAQGPATGAANYEAERGEPFGEALHLTYAVEVIRPDAALTLSEFEVWLGEDWAAWRSGEDGRLALADLRAARLLTWDDTEETIQNASLYGEARRRLDIYTRLSDAGALEQISFGQAGVFERVWLEAAMGVAARTDTIAIEDSGERLIARHEGAVMAQIAYPSRAPESASRPEPSGIATAQGPGGAPAGDAASAPAEARDEALDEAPGQGAEPELAIEREPDADLAPAPARELDPGTEPLICRPVDPPTDDVRAALITTALRHGAPLHPAIIAALDARAAIPCALSFDIYSPGSPQGRTEIWSLSAVETGAGPLDGAVQTLVPAAMDLLGPAGARALAAARGEAGPAPDAASLHAAMLALRDDGDLAGAFLLSVQETNQFGPCPDEAIGSARFVCAERLSLSRAGIGNAAFERASEGVAAMREGDHATAVTRLSAFLEREDGAGAAARVLVANELVAWGRAGLETWPDLDPAALLAEALVLDVFASDLFWHLGRRYLEAGAPQAAWTLFDLGRALPGREPTAILDQAGALEAALSRIAPGLAPAPPVAPNDGVRFESGQFSFPDE